MEIANRVQSITSRRLPAEILKLYGSSPLERMGKSSVGRQVNVKRARQDVSTKLPLSPLLSNCTWDPSGSLRTISKRVWAGAVVVPWTSTSAGTVSTISKSISVAFKLKFSSGASNFTLERIGMVLRRSTTLWMCVSIFKSIPRSIVSFMATYRSFFHISFSIPIYIKLA